MVVKKHAELYTFLGSCDTVAVNFKVSGAASCLRAAVIRYSAANGKTVLSGCVLVCKIM